MPGRGAKQLKREWIDSDDSDDGTSEPAVLQTGNGNIAVAAVDLGKTRVPAQGVDAIPEPSERAEARQRMASSLLANSSDDEADAHARHAAGDGLYEHSKTNSASGRPRGGGIRNRPPPVSKAAEVDVVASVPEDMASRSMSSLPGRMSSLQRVRDLVSQDDPTGESPNREQFHKRRVHTVSSHVSRMLRHTSPGPDGSPQDVDAMDRIVSSDSDEPSWGGAHQKKPPARRRVAKSQARSDEEDEYCLEDAKRPSAAEVAEALRKKQKTQMAITDCLKQAMVLDPSRLSLCPSCNHVPL